MRDTRWSISSADSISARWTFIHRPKSTRPLVAAPPRGDGGMPIDLVRFSSRGHRISGGLAANVRGRRSQRRAGARRPV